MSKDDLRSSKLRADTSDAVKQASSFWREEPSCYNAFQVQGARCGGYDIFDLASNRSPSDVLFLMLTGELPSTEQSKLLQQAMIVFINPGPRHEATRVGVTAAASMTYEEHLVPLVTSAFGGKHGGAGAIRASMHFIDAHMGHSVASVANNETTLSTCSFVGNEFGSACAWAQRCIEYFALQFTDSASIQWLAEFNGYIRAKSNAEQGVLIVGLVAAIFLELGIDKNKACGLYQLFAAPGMFAHAAEYIRKPATSLPFVQDNNYVLQD